MASSKIAKILEILNDEKWHTLEDIQEKTQLNKSQVQQTIRFLKEYNFVIVDEENKEIKIEKMFKNF